MNEWQPNLIPKHVCICCGAPLDAATNVFSERKPACGDVTVCLGCGYVMVFTNKLTMRRPNLKESQEIASDPNVKILKQLIAERNAEKAGRH